MKLWQSRRKELFAEQLENLEQPVSQTCVRHHRPHSASPAAATLKTRGPSTTADSSAAVACSPQLSSLQQSFSGPKNTVRKAASSTLIPLNQRVSSKVPLKGGLQQRLIPHLKALITRTGQEHLIVPTIQGFFKECQGQCCKDRGAARQSSA